MTDSEYAAARLALAMLANTREEFNTRVAELDAARDKASADKKILYPVVPDERVLASGTIQYLADCTHDLRGQTIPMQAF